MNKNSTLLRLLQTNQKELLIQDFRLLGHLLNGIELIHKTVLIHSNKLDEWHGLSVSDCEKYYRKNLRIKIKSINKNSPIELEIIIKHLDISIEFIDLFFKEEQQEQIVNEIIIRAFNIDITNSENKKRLKQIWMSISGCKMIIKKLNLVRVSNNE